MTKDLIRAVPWREFRPGDKIASVHYSYGGSTVYDVWRKRDGGKPSGRWTPVSRSIDLRPGDRIRATAPDDSAILEEVISRTGDRSDMSDIRRMFGTRSVEAYFNYGWIVEKWATP